MTNTTQTFTQSIQAFVTEAESFFSGVKTEAEAFVADFAPKVEQVLEIAFEDLAQIAGQAILSEGAAVLTNSESFGSAVTNVIQTVEAKGKTVAVASAQTAVTIAAQVASQVAAGVSSTKSS